MEKMGFGSSQREKMDMILEPMQVMIQLALLKNAPIGSKISVSNNILNIQKPTYAQGLVRWWNGDNKDDLYYLFHAIRRYYKWYKNEDNKIYNYILDLAKTGIKNLIKTSMCNYTKQIALKTSKLDAKTMMKYTELF